METTVSDIPEKGAMAPGPPLDPGGMVKELVLGCVQSWLNRFGREDIIKMVADNFIDKEIFDGLRCLCDCLGLDPPKKRFNTNLRGNFFTQRNIDNWNGRGKNVIEAKKLEHSKRG